MKVDYLIVGQGLAGSLLAWQLLARNQRVLVVDRDEEVTSSKVAAGLVTPLAGAKLDIKPDFEERLSFARKFYWEAEEMTGGLFFFHRPILKLFRNEADEAEWKRVSSIPDHPVSNYAKPLETDLAAFRAEHGGCEMSGGGWLDVPAFLELTRQHLLERASYAISNLNSHEVETSLKGIQWRNIEAKKIIFAEGWRATTNRFFDWLPMRSALGDILELTIPTLTGLEKIVNKGVWLLPLGNGRFRTGSNYRHRFDDHPSPDQEGRDEIVEKFKTLSAAPFEITGHHCGIRPIIRRSQIFMGPHPAFDSVLLFNGLGSKGVVNGPWHADRLASFLVEGVPLPAASDIRGNLI